MILPIGELLSHQKPSPKAYPPPAEVARNKKKPNRVTGHRSRVTGFTLIEMMIVLAIMALIVGMSLPYFGRFTSGSSIRAATRQISSLLYTGRSLAITHRKPYAVVFDVKEGEMTVQEAESSAIVEKRYSVSSVILFESPDESDPVTFKDDRVIFTPTGGLAGDTGTIWLRDRKKNRVSITVHQSTGRIKVELSTDKNKKLDK